MQLTAQQSYVSELRHVIVTEIQSTGEQPIDDKISIKSIPLVLL